MMTTSSTAAAAPPEDAASEEPHGLCWKQKPRLHSWPERYVRLDGYSLHFFKAKSAAEAATAKPEKSSIDDVRGCALEGGWEDWGLMQLPRVVVSRSDLGKAGLKFCFAAEQQRDEFLSALSNVAAGRRWNATVCGAGSAAPHQDTAREFELHVVDSAEFCLHGTRLGALVAVDLQELCSAVSKALVGTGGRTAAEAATRSIRMEVLDSDFNEWIGPLTLADVPSAATIRVKADESGAESAEIERHRQVLQRHREQRGTVRNHEPQHQRGAQHVQDTRRGQPIVGLRMV